MYYVYVLMSAKDGKFYKGRPYRNSGSHREGGSYYAIDRMGSK